MIFVLFVKVVIDCYNSLTMEGKKWYFTGYDVPMVKGQKV